MDALPGLADVPGAAPPPYASKSAAFPIAIVIAIGFMVTSLILVTYYLLVVRCWLRAGANGPGGSRLRRRDGDVMDRVSAVFFTDGLGADDPPRGVDADVVAALPVVKYHRRRRAASSAALECAVCLSEFVEREPLKMLPACSHAFHIDCIDTWLFHNVSCPLCRTVVTAAPTTRDQELAAAAAGDRRISRLEGGSCRFPKHGDVQEPIRRSLSMDFLPGHRGRKPPQKEAVLPSHADVAGTSSSVANTPGVGETSGRFRRLMSSFGLGRSSRSTVLPIDHLDP